MQGRYGSYYEYYSYGSSQIRRRISFSEKEIFHIAISIVVLTFAFSFAFSGSALEFSKKDYGEMMVILTVSFFAVLTGFLLHELAHKISAQKYGCWAEYRYSEQGLLFTFLSSLVGFLIAVPGAVYIDGNINDKQNGVISLAGPTTNILIALVFLPFIYLTESLINLIITFICFINLFLALFNMLPIPPLDGSKVIRWNIGIYLGTIGLIIFIFILSKVWTLYIRTLGQIS